MKKIILTFVLILTGCLSLLTSCNYAQKNISNQKISEPVVEETETLPKEVVYIPDARFKNYLLNNNAININKDDEIQITEAQAFIRHAKGFV